MTDFRTAPEKFLDRMDKKRSQFEGAFDAELITKARYQILLSEWQKSYERAIKRLDKLESEAAYYIEYDDSEYEYIHKPTFFKSFYEAIKDQNIVKESLCFYRGVISCIHYLKGDIK